ncbi:MAG TPA: roadblock/LC7 domain-containing protein [Acidimicrobiales bacterium]
MTAGPTSDVPVEALVRAQLLRLRSQVRSVTGSLVATRDGLLVAADLPGRAPEPVAALTSTLLGLARYAVEVTATGALTGAVVRGTGGHLAAYALGDAATLTVVGGADLDVGQLHLEIRPVLDRLVALSDRFVGFADVGLVGLGGPVALHATVPGIVRRRRR